MLYHYMNRKKIFYRRWCSRCRIKYYSRHKGSTVCVDCDMRQEGIVKARRRRDTKVDR